MHVWFGRFQEKIASIASRHPFKPVDAADQDAPDTPVFRSWSPVFSTSRPQVLPGPASRRVTLTVQGGHRARGRSRGVARPTVRGSSDHAVPGYDRWSPSEPRGQLATSSITPSVTRADQVAADISRRRSPRGARGCSPRGPPALSSSTILSSNPESGAGARERSSVRVSSRCTASTSIPGLPRARSFDVFSVSRCACSPRRLSASWSGSSPTWSVGLDLPSRVPQRLVGSAESPPRPQSRPPFDAPASGSSIVSLLIRQSVASPSAACTADTEWDPRSTARSITSPGGPPATRLAKVGQRRCPLVLRTPPMSSPATRRDPRTQSLDYRSRSNSVVLLLMVLVPRWHRQSFVHAYAFLGRRARRPKGARRASTQARGVIGDSLPRRGSGR